MQATRMPISNDEALPVARGHVYSFLAAALSDPLQRHLDIALDESVQTVAVAGADLLASEAFEVSDLAPGERSPRQFDLAPVVRGLARPREEIAEEYHRIFGLLAGKAAPPYETEYCRSTLTFYRTQQLADIAGFYRAFGLEPNRETPERQDHISVELEFMARLTERELVAEAAQETVLRKKAPLCRDAQKKFFEAHLAWWTPAFAELLRRESTAGLYTAIADALSGFIPCERSLLGIPPSSELPAPVPEPDAVAETDGCAGCAANQLV